MRLHTNTKNTNAAASTASDTAPTFVAKLSSESNGYSFQNSFHGLRLRSRIISRRSA